MHGFMRGLGSTVLAFAIMGATLFGASFAISATGDQQGAALAFMSGGILLAIFGAPAWLVAFARWRAADVATLAALLERHGAALYKRYAANAAIGARDFAPSADWPEDVIGFRRVLQTKFLFLGRRRFHALVTARMEAMRQSAQGFGRPQSADPASSPARLAEAELRALGWRAEARDGPGLLGPVVLAERDGVRAVLRCEGKRPLSDRLQRALVLRRHYRADLVGLVDAREIADEERAEARRLNVMLLSAGSLRAMHPYAAAVWRRRRRVASVPRTA